jgi:hypothetical protein
MEIDMSVWICKGITKQANIADNWKEYDSLERAMEKNAKNHGIHISRVTDEDGDSFFVISNIRLESEPFYEGCIFEGDMGVPADESFDGKADLFIEELNSNEQFALFHNLNWSDAARRYYSHS